MLHDYGIEFTEPSAWQGRVYRDVERRRAPHRHDLRPGAVHGQEVGADARLVAGLQLRSRGLRSAPGATEPADPGAGGDQARRTCLRARRLLRIVEPEQSLARGG